MIRLVSAMAAVAVSVALLGVPGGGSAHAAPSTTLSKAQMAQALAFALTGANAAGKAGWKAAFTTSLGPIVTTQVVTFDARTRRTYQQKVTGGVRYDRYAVAEQGIYTTLADTTSHAAVKMMGRPDVTFAFAKDAELDIEESAALALSGPSTRNRDLTDNSFDDATRTKQSDGSVDYRYLDNSTDVTVHVDATGAVRGYDRVSANYSRTVTYAFGPQTVSLPPASTVMTKELLAAGLAYLDMTVQVKAVADLTVGVSRATRALPVAALRAVAAVQARDSNRRTGAMMVRVRNVTGGARLYATNPWTKTTVGYTVTTNGQRVALRRSAG